LAVGAILLRELSIPRTVSELWNRVRHSRSVGTYERFVLALDLLFIGGAIHLEGPFLVRRVG
jgi:hypothetical protein